ncbi:MAG: gliding motility-associated ABC transporter permease subunit GldF, partial [Flavobacteriaceae bacterium]|nr:gliding motility-associated ABC transporter permease subunit GldF [Flavobacteriaceae bacterium]
MLAILRKEINSFFSSSIGYLVIGLFLLVSSLFLWLFKSGYNILDYGFAEMSSFFLLAPWVLLFLIPAVTMRSFSDEKKQGTLELLLTKPISKLHIVLGKYFGAFVLIVLALIPTLLYVYSVYQLANPYGNLDLGAVFGSYIGLLLLVGTYTSVGVFTSSLSDNQIVAFISAVFICLLLYIGLDGIADLVSVSAIELFGINSHFKSISRGVLDTKDIIYFLSMIAFFIAFTSKQLSTSGIKKSDWQRLAILLVALLLINFGSHSIFSRIDITKDQRYTLSESSKSLVKDLDSPLIIDVFLEGEGFPSEFKRLQAETRYLLEEYKNVNPNINFQFINPLEEDTSRENNLRQLTQRGLIPMQLSVQENGKTSNEMVIPWALASYQRTLNEDPITVKVPLVKNKIGSNQQDLVLNSVQH